MNNKFSPNTFISTVGLVLSLVSLAIHYLNFRYTQSRMKFKIQPNSYYCNAKDFSVSGFESKYFAFISVKISNLSSLPITIDEAFLNYYILNGGHFNNLKFEVPKVKNPKYINAFETPNETVSCSIYPYIPATLPLRIEPFDTILCSFKMPFDSHINKKSHKLFISTSRKTYKIRLTLKEYHELISFKTDSELSTK